MADTTINSSLVKKMWSKELLLQAKHYSFLKKLEGSSKMNILYEPPVPEGKGKGDNITVPLLKSLSGAGVSDDDALRTHEEGMVYSASSLTFHQQRNGVIQTGRYEESKTLQNMRSDAKEQLGDWMARYEDSVKFTALQTDAAITDIDDAAALSAALNIAFGGEAKDWNALTSGDILTVALIRRVKRYAILRGVRPARLPDGREMLALIISMEQEYDLVNSDGWNELQEHANVRGDANPLIAGSIGVVDGVYVYTDVLTVGGGNGATHLINQPKTNFRATQALLLGAQGGAFAYSQIPSWDEEEVDYKNQLGIATRVIMGACKPVINLGTKLAISNRDYGICYVCTAATKVGG